MKKTRLLTAVILASVAAMAIAGCNTPASGDPAVASRIDGGQTQISVEPSGSDNKKTDVYKFTYKGYDIVPGTEMKPVLEAIGDPVEPPFQAASCAGQGMDTTYNYPGFYIQTYEEEGSELIRGVVITDPLVDCGGIHIGDTLEAVKEVYGTPTSEDDFGLEYRSGNVALRFTTDGFNSITDITYIVMQWA